MLSGVGDLIDHGRQSGWAKRVNALTGVLAQQSLDGSVSRTTNPAIFTPDRRWSPDAPGLRVLTDLLATLGASQVISGTSLTGLAGSASEVAVPAYPEQAQAQELNHAYLERVKTNRADVTSLQQSLGGTPQTTDPALVLDPLVVALDAAGSTAFRTDAAVGEANLATVESTTAGIRGGVEISSAGNSYTLASSSSPLVLTVQNNLPYNVPLRVEITGGEFVGLTVTNPELQVVPAGRSQQVKIPAEVSRSGQFQVRRRARRSRRQHLGATGAVVGRVHRVRGIDGDHHHRRRRRAGVDGGVADRAAAPRKAGHHPGVARGSTGRRCRDARPPRRHPTTDRTRPGQHRPRRPGTRESDPGLRAGRNGPIVTRPDAATQQPADDVAGMKTARTGGVVRAGAVMAVATLVSRITGFLAKVVILSVLGFGIVNDAYTIANTLPNIVFELLIGGVLTSVAIPLLSRARSDPDGGEGYTQRLMTVAFVGLIVATGLAVAAAPLLTRLYLSGGEGTVDQGLADSLAYLLLPQIFFYGIAALFGAILNTKEKFGVPAWAPVANNLVVIAVGVGLHLLPGSGADGALTELSREQFLLLSLGTTLGIVMQAVVMLPALRRTGFRFRWRWGGDRRLLEAGQLMLWAVAYVLVSQVGYIVVTNVASQNVEGGISLWAFASMLFQLPYGIIGVSILTAIMPRMSRHAAAGQMVDVKNDASLANRLSIVALTPVAAGIIVLAGALAILASFYGAVSLDDTLVLGTTLAALAFGLVPFAVTLVQMRVFYAMKDARTPVLINAIMVAVRVPLLIACATLDDSLIVPGMAAATSISYLIGAITGEIWLRVRYGPMGTKRTLVTLIKMTVAGAVGAGAALLAGNVLLSFDVDDLLTALVSILFSGTVGLLVIAAIGALLKVEELLPLRNRVVRLVRSVFRRSQPDGAPNPEASPRVQDTGRGTLAGDPRTSDARAAGSTTEASGAAQTVVIRALTSEMNPASEMNTVEIDSSSIDPAQIDPAQIDPAQTASAERRSNHDSDADRPRRSAHPDKQQGAGVQPGAPRQRWPGGRPRRDDRDPGGRSDRPR